MESFIISWIGGFLIGGVAGVFVGGRLKKKDRLLITLTQEAKKQEEAKAHASRT